MVELRTEAATVVVVLETPARMRVVEKNARVNFEDDEKQHFRVKKKKRGDKVLNKAVPQEDDRVVSCLLVKNKICWQIPLLALFVVCIHTPKDSSQRMV